MIVPAARARNGSSDLKRAPSRRNENPPNKATYAARDSNSAAIVRRLR